MILPKNSQKSYGVFHSKNYFSFIGFCKKTNSSEIQKVDIYLDDKLVDTILADKNIENIENIYDVENFGFEYILPNEYIGQKSLISFKNHETKENLQNSPYELIKKNHPKFNEMSFLNSLESPIDQEKIRDVYCPNSIGFLATQENLEDEEFVGYINELMVRFPKAKFKKFFFDNSLDNIENSIKISTIEDITNNVCVLVTNPILQDNHFDQLITKQQFKFENVFVTPCNKQNLYKKINEIVMEPFISIIKNNLQAFGLDSNDIKNISHNHILMIKKSFEKHTNIDIIDNKEFMEMVFKEMVFNHIKLALKDKNFIKFQKLTNKTLVTLNSK